MLAITFDKYSNAGDYNVATLPVPKINADDEILIKVYAASINTCDVKMASTNLGPLLNKNATFPYKAGEELSGTIVAVGPAVRDFKTGDAVFARLPNSHRGSFAEYVTVPSKCVVRKPSMISHEQAASISITAQAAYQVLKQADEALQGGLAGKTVLIPAGLGGTGSFGVQMAKNYFKAGKVITTLSPAKMKTYEKLLGAGVVDQAIDYTQGTASVINQIGKGTVDFMLDTAEQTMALVSTLKPRTGLIISLSTSPNGNQYFKDNTDAIWYLRYVLNVLDLTRKFYLSKWWHITYSYHILSTEPKDMAVVAGMVESGEIKPLITDVIDLAPEEIQRIRKGSQLIQDGKGAVGKLVLKVAKDSNVARK